jgi:glycosyltransferase involved in cell wall biosynthesis
MSDLPLITLGIPIYNAADMLEQALLSALNQTYPNIEYIWVDDKGNSMEVARTVLERHWRKDSVRIIDQQHNQGIGAARNAIVEHAKGQYLFTMDCDDIIIPTCIELLYNKMREHPVDFVAASFVRRDLQGNEYPGRCQYTDTLIDGGKYSVAQYRYGQGKTIFVPTWNKLYNTDFLHRHNIRCIPNYFVDDAWFTYQVIINACSCHLLPDQTVIYTYRNPQSVTEGIAQKGYTYQVAQQYVGTHQLISDYIRPLTRQSFYMGAVLDIMKMSLFDLYRTCESTAITQEEKQYFTTEFLQRRFAYPRRWRLTDKNVYLALPLLAFYALPTTIKQYIIRLVVRIDIRRPLFKRWLHF